MSKKKLTIDEIFKEQLKMTDGDERKAAELALSLGAYGLFDDADDESKQKAIDEFLEEYGIETEPVPDKNPKVEPVGDGEEVVKNVEDKLDQIDKERGDLKVTKEENKKRKYESSGGKISPEGIKTIDVNAKEWRDKVNGNSYFSGVVIINYGMPDEKILKMPHQYGYGEMYLQVAGEFFEKDSMTPLWRWCQNNGIILRYHKTEVRRKKDLMEKRNINESVVDDVLNEMEEDQFVQKYIDQAKFLADSGDPDYKIYSRFADIIMNDFSIGYDDAYTIAERFIDKDVDYVKDTDFDNKYNDFRDDFMIFDNGGETIDRYTIINTGTGDVYSADEHPMSPNGFGQYSHNIYDEGMEVNDYISNNINLGKEIIYDKLPEDVKKFIQLKTEYRNEKRGKYRKENFIDVQVLLGKDGVKDKPKEKQLNILDKSIDSKDMTIELNDEIDKIERQLEDVIENIPTDKLKLTDKSKKKLDRITEICKILMEI